MVDYKELDSKLETIARIHMEEYVRKHEEAIIALNRKMDLQTVAICGIVGIVIWLDWRISRRPKVIYVEAPHAHNV